MCIWDFIQARVEIPLTSSTQPDTDSENVFENPFNVAFDYQHYTKNRSNCLYISLQKRRKYRARAVSGFKVSLLFFIRVFVVISNFLSWEYWICSWLVMRILKEYCGRIPTDNINDHVFLAQANQTQLQINTWLYK